MIKRIGVTKRWSDIVIYNGLANFVGMNLSELLIFIMQVTWLEGEHACSDPLTGLHWDDTHILILSLIYSHAEVADDTSVGMKEQVQQILNQIDSRLRDIGSDRTHLLSVTIYVKHLDDVPLLNEQWDSFIPDGHAPSRACVQANMVNKDYLVEMVCTAAALKWSLGEDLWKQNFLSY